MRRPAPKTIDKIKHPGPKARDRLPHIPCRAEPFSMTLEAGEPLLATLGNWAAKFEYSSAVLDLTGMTLNAFEYVMPDRAIDDRHAAWYSDTQNSSGACLSEAVAVLGWRDGNWFAHIHAYWQEDGQNHLGHLMPHTLSIDKGSDISGYGIKGARFEADFDPETEFTLFRVKVDQAETDRFETPQKPDNAVIATLAPFEDLHTSILKLGKRLAADNCVIMGLGSLAGAEFVSDPAMTELISEILLRPGTRYKDNETLRIPVRCVDLNGTLFEAVLKPDHGPTLVTCELLLVASQD